MIFVQLASYRDPELMPTVQSLISNAKNPEQLRIAIYNQDEEEKEWLRQLPNSSVIDIPYNESRGTCYARYELNKLYNGEEYMLQLDSHHRFAKDWDTTLIEMLESLPGKPVLTSYVPSYDPETDSRIHNPWCMEIDPNQPLDIPCFRPYYSDHKKPKPTYFFSGHFAFARGQFILDVPYDPELYFHGEEITMAARAFCKGYNMYHPHKVIVWHEYTRKGRVKQWDDNPEWWKMDVSSKEKVKKILSGEISIDDVRTLAEYKQLIGI